MFLQLARDATKDSRLKTRLHNATGKTAPWNAKNAFCVNNPLTATDSHQSLKKYSDHIELASEPQTHFRAVYTSAFSF